VILNDENDKYLPSPVISIVTATFNAETCLPKLMGSLQDQSSKGYEWIVIDGASHDGTLEMLESNRNLVTVLNSEPDRGIYDAWNKGVCRARGEWLYFLGADDFLWGPDAIERAVSYLLNIPKNITIAYAQIMLVNASGKDISTAGKDWPEVKDRFKQIMCIPHQGVFHRRSLFEGGEFDASFRIAGDYEFLLRDLKKNDAVFIPEIIAGMRQGGVSSKPENAIKALKEIRRAQKMHGFKLPGLVWIAALVRAYVRTWAWKILGERHVVRILDAYRRMVGLPAYWTKL
jgi:glycosyltransferase involved in cell wall biosynthesis